MKKKKYVPIDLSDYQISDEGLKEIIKSVQLVSSLQLAKILSKPNDNSLRVSRSKGTGFKYYKDPNGVVYYNLDKNKNVFYNFPEILNEMELIKNDR